VPRPVFLVATGAQKIWALQGKSLLRIDPATNEVTRSTPVRVSGFPSLGAGGGAAWFAVGADNQLLRIDEGSGRITATTSLPGSGADPLAANGRVWVVVFTTNGSQVWSVDPQSAALTSSVSVPIDTPFGLASGAGALWTTDHETGTLWRIDPKPREATKAATVGHHPIAVAADEDAVWVGVQRDELFFR